jgi:hypothetical protein
VFCWALFLHREMYFIIIHSVSFFPSFPPPLASSNSPTFGNMYYIYMIVIIYIYIYICDNDCIYIGSIFHIWKNTCDLFLNWLTSLKTMFPLTYILFYVWHKVSSEIFLQIILKNPFASVLPSFFICPWNVLSYVNPLFWWNISSLVFWEKV